MKHVTKHKYQARCSCGRTTTKYFESHAHTILIGSGDLDGQTCACGNGGFIFRRVEKSTKTK